jgi:hypothetical protein
MATNELKSHRLDNLEKQLGTLRLGYELLMEDYKSLLEHYKYLNSFSTHAEKVMIAMSRKLDTISDEVFHHAPSKKYESNSSYRRLPAIKDEEERDSDRSGSESE